MTLVAGFLYIAAGVTPCLLLFLAKNDYCGSNVSEKPDCPHPSVSDITHQAVSFRGGILAASFIRLLVCGGILVSIEIGSRDGVTAGGVGSSGGARQSRVVGPEFDYSFRNTNRQLHGNASAAGARPPEATSRVAGGLGAPPVNKVGRRRSSFEGSHNAQVADQASSGAAPATCRPAFGLILLTWIITDVAQLMVSNKANSTLHNVMSQASQVALVLLHYLVVSQTVFSNSFLSEQDDVGVGRGRGTSETRFLCGLLVCLILLAMLGAGLFLVVNLGNVDANEDWSNAQWVALAFQATLFAAMGCTIITLGLGTNAFDG